MKQVSCDPPPLCQGDTLNRKVRLDVIPFFLPLIYLFINFCLFSSWLYQAGLIHWMLQDQPQLACGVFHIRIVTLCPTAGRYILRGPLRLIVAMT